MKKVKLLITLIVLSFLLTSCTSDRHAKLVKENDLLAIPVQIDTNAEMVFLNNQKLYYFTDEVSPKTPDLANKTLNEYDFIDKKNRKISSFADISIYSGSIALTNNSLYMPLATNIENILVEITPEKGRSKTINKWKTFPPLSYVYYLKNNLILFGPNSIDEFTTDYYINKIDLVSNEEKNIVKKKIKNEKGQLIACIDVDENNIYAFSITATDHDQKYSIIKYDLDGTQLSVYPFDLKAFFNPVETLDYQDDAIVNIYKEKDYFILNTLNGRVFIFKLRNNQLLPLKIPENFYKNTPSGFRFMQYYDGDSDFAYFYNTIENNNVVTVFDYLSETFTSLEFPVTNSIYSFFRNANGDLIVKKSNDQNSSQLYYYIERSILKQ